ncbi:MAG: alpha-amlyase [Bacteroidetes bacterium]|nr:MAG: alpha-amlyase [Bacteroidota bacterium]
MIKKILILSLLILLLSCQNNNKLIIPQKSKIFGLATPIYLNQNKTVVHLSDFFLKFSEIDSIKADSNLFTNLTPDKKLLTLETKNKSLPQLSCLNIWSDGFRYDILVKKSRKVNYNIQFDAKGKKYSSVQITGDINGWNPKATNLENNNGIWEKELSLNPGKYSYQVVLDGKWMLDPNNKDSVDNNSGGFNSLMKVGNFNPELSPELFTDNYTDKEINFACNSNIIKFYAFWQNYELNNSFVEKGNNAISIKIPQEAKKVKRSFIRVWAYNEQGVSNDILVPLDYGKVISNSKDIDRSDKQALVMYFLMVDRFYNGNEDNDHPLDDPNVLPKVNYFGGDIAGVLQKVKQGYFSDLGVNTIWISPIAQNPLGAYGEYPDPHTKFSGYHGYWPISSSKVDFRFGTSDEVKNFVNVAHQNNFNVLLDYVSNHVHQNHPLYKQHPDWATSMYLPDGTRNLEKWDEYRLTTWFDTFLPTLDFSKPELVDLMTDSAVYWIKTFDFDGFRHDATKHIPEVFWRTLTKKLKTEIPASKTLYQIGETYGNRDLIGSYVNSGELDAQFDFNVYDDAVAVFANDDQPFSRLKNSILQSFLYYGYHNLMGYITGNQDRGRFISYASGDLLFNEDAKKAGWTRDIEVTNPVGYKKLASLIAFNMTIPGVPVIYYGDEIGMPGGNDPDNRRMMRFNNLKPEEAKLKEIATKLIHLRRNNLSLIYGDTKIIKTSNKLFVYARKYFNKVSIIVFNKDNIEKNVSFNIPEQFVNSNLKANFNSEFNLDKNKINIKLQANSFEILTN